MAQGWSGVRRLGWSGAQLRPGQPCKFAQKRPCITRIDDILDIELFRCPERRSHRIQPRLDFFQLRCRIIRCCDF